VRKEFSPVSFFQGRCFAQLIKGLYTLGIFLNPEKARRLLNSSASFGFRDGRFALEANMNSEQSTRERNVVLSPQGKPISDEEIRRTRNRSIDRLQWCSGDEREIIGNWLNAKGLL
jgi:hypothetical protein